MAETDIEIAGLSVMMMILFQICQNGVRLVLHKLYHFRQVYL